MVDGIRCRKRSPSPNVDSSTSAIPPGFRCAPRPAANRSATSVERQAPSRGSRGCACRKGGLNSTRSKRSPAPARTGRRAGLRSCARAWLSRALMRAQRTAAGLISTATMRRACRAANTAHDTGSRAHVEHPPMAAHGSGIDLRGEEFTGARASFGLNTLGSDHEMARRTRSPSGNRRSDPCRRRDSRSAMALPRRRRISGRRASLAACTGVAAAGRAIMTASAPAPASA